MVEGPHQSAGRPPARLSYAAAERADTPIEPPTSASRASIRAGLPVLAPPAAPLTERESETSAAWSVGNPAGRSVASSAASVSEGPRDVLICAEAGVTEPAGEPSGRAAANGSCSTPVEEFSPVEDLPPPRKRTARAQDVATRFQAPVTERALLDCASQGPVPYSMYSRASQSVRVQVCRRNPDIVLLDCAVDPTGDLFPATGSAVSLLHLDTLARHTAEHYESSGLESGRKRRRLFSTADDDEEQSSGTLDDGRV